MAGHRIRRSLAVRIDGRWVDVGKLLVSEGYALWLPDSTENAWNVTYSTLAQQAAATRRRLYNREYCGAGPGRAAQVRMTLNPNAEGNDGETVNGEYAILENTGTRPLPIAGWWFRDSALRQYTFPSGATIPADGSVRLRMGAGRRTAQEFFWGLDSPPFRTPATAGTSSTLRATFAPG